MNHELFLFCSLASLAVFAAPADYQPDTRVWENNFFSSVENFIFSFSVLRSVEFENSFGKVLVFVAGFGSTLFPFSFPFYSFTCNRTKARLCKAYLFIVKILLWRRSLHARTSSAAKLGVFVVGPFKLSVFFFFFLARRSKDDFCFPFSPRALAFRNSN